MLATFITGIVMGTRYLWEQVDMAELQALWGTDKTSSTQSARPSRLLTKQAIATLLDHSAVVNLEQKTFDLIDGKHHFRVSTTLNLSLQKYLLKKLERYEHISRGIPRHMSVVAVEPDTGKLLAMVSYDQKSSASRPSVIKIFPAASIFKIVTATAALETCGLTPSSILDYNGGKYTLYKQQIQQQNNQYTQQISLKNAFAQSVNPVFGKLGAFYLGKTVIAKYAEAFGFNAPIEFEIGLSPSVISLTDEPYHLAEIGCGFNRTTCISPLHAAMLGSAVMNDGIMMEPMLIDEIVDTGGNTVYTGHPAILTHAMQAATCRQLKTLMKTTIHSGTGRKSFRGYQEDSILSRLTIGGKTGTICNKKHDVRYDWFVGFAEDQQKNQKMALAVVVGHQKYIGTRATQYARMAITRFFQDYFVANDANSCKKNHT
jgi:cell division protein FtsI/penicillin-binding protein 2